MVVQNRQNELLKFVNRIYAHARGGGIIYIQTYHDTKKEFGGAGRAVTIDMLRHEITSGKLKGKSDYGLCITPNTFEKLNISRTKNNVSGVTSIVVDIDTPQAIKELTTQIKKLNLRPQIICSRAVSDDRFKYHLYYIFDSLLKNTPDIENKIHEIQNALINYFKSDKQIKSLKQVMRLPYTFNYKDKNNVSFYSCSYSDQPEYDLNAMHDFLTAGKNPKEKKETKKKGAEEKIKSEIQPIVNDEFIVQTIKRIYENAEPVNSGEGRSRELFLLGIKCFSWGLSFETALQLGHWLNTELFTEPETESVIKHQIESAYKYHRGEFGEFRTEYQAIKSDEKKSDYVQKQKLYYRIFKLLKKYVYVFNAERLIDTKTGLEYTNINQINHHLSHLTHSHILLKDILKQQLIFVCDKMSFTPEEPRIYKKDGLIIYNRFDARIFENLSVESVNQKSIDLFKKHIEYMTNSEYEFNAVMNYFAYCVQNPGHKIKYALCIISDYEGTGRSILSEQLFDRIYKKYSVNVENNDLNSSFNEYMSDSLLIFVHELAQGDSFKFMDKMRNKITEQKVIIDTKFAKKYTIECCANFVFFSNKINALRVTANDRRLLVVHNSKPPQPQKYYDRLAEAFQNDYASIYQFLCEWDLSKFNPHARPELTEGKKLMIEQSMTELQIYLSGLLNSKQGTFANQVFTIDQLISYCDDNAPQALKYKITFKAVSQFLREHKFNSRYIQKRMPDKSRIRKTFYSTPDCDIMSLDENKFNVTPGFIAESTEKKVQF